MRRDGRATDDPGRVFVDSGAWIAAASQRDAHHAEAAVLFRRAASRRIPLLTTNLVIAKVHRFLLFGAGIQAAAAVLARMEGSSLVSIEFVTRVHHVAAQRWLARLNDQVITYADAISFAVMESARCRTAMTFDHNFAVAGFSIWRVGFERVSR